VLNFNRIKLLYGLYRRISDAIIRYMCYCDIYIDGGDKIDRIMIKMVLLMFMVISL